jgi:hypothetical protein
MVASFSLSLGERVGVRDQTGSQLPKLADYRVGVPPSARPCFERPATHHFTSAAADNAGGRPPGGRGTGSPAGQLPPPPSNGGSPLRRMTIAAITFATAHKKSSTNAIPVRTSWP